VAKEYTGFTENATHEDRVASGIIAADGSLVLRLYYDRETFDVSFNSNDGSSVSDIIGVRYEATIDKPVDPEKEGYTFGGWFKEESLVNEWIFASDKVTEAITLYAKWEANTDTVYTVQHYQQDVTGDGYTLKETENLTGTTDVLATAVAKEYTGFTENATHEDRVASGIIAADGSLVLRLYYDRETFDVSFNSNDGSSVSDIIGVRYEATIDKPVDPEKEGYTFGGWFKEESLVNEWIFASDKVTEAITLYAKWEANTDTVYTVQHYQQDVTGDGYTLKETENLTGTTDVLATAVAKEYTGFTENATHEDRVASGIIAADGSLVLRLYYDRETFDVSFNSNDGSSVSDIIGVRYEATIDKPVDPEKEGYTFGGWFKEESLVNEWIFASDKVTEAITLYAKWEANTDTVYTVQHYQQDVTGDGYTLKETENLTGTTDVLATAVAKEYTGFTENATHEDRVASGIIAADGSLVLRLYYDRETFDVSFNSNDGSSVSDIIGVRYEATIDKPVDPEKEGYTFGGWFKEESLVNEWIFASDKVTEAITLYAKWEANTDTVYTVQHYQQDVTGDGYTLKETENLTGTTDVLATAVAKEYTGFTENATHEDRVASGTIAADGSLVLKLGTQTVSHGSTATAPDNPTKEGYKFDGWYADESLETTAFAFDTEIKADTIIYAKWTHNDLLNLKSFIDESSTRERPSYTNSIEEWDTYWGQYNTALTAAEGVYNTLKDAGTLTTENVASISTAKTNLQREVEILDAIEDFDSAWGGRENPKGLVETVYERSLVTGSFQPGRLRCYYEKEDSYLYWLMSDFLQGQDYYPGTTGTGMNPGLQNVMMSENLVQINPALEQ
jgi:uncharacterized repeat protein (TIGR02543 family)